MDVAWAGAGAVAGRDVGMRSSSSSSKFRGAAVAARSLTCFTATIRRLGMKNYHRAVRPAIELQKTAGASSLGRSTGIGSSLPAAFAGERIACTM